MNASPKRHRAFFICGSINQTKQMHAVARALEYEASFSPWYGDTVFQIARHAGLIEWTIGGNRLRQRCIEYLRQHRLDIDVHGTRGGWDLVVTCSDLIVPRNVRGRPLVVVQEGMLDPPNALFPLARHVPGFPLYLAGTAATGLSGRYDRLCAASAGYRELYVRNGADPAKVVVTGIPNFDDCEQYRKNDFPHHGYVLVCTSDIRENKKRDDRGELIQRAVRIAAGRPLFFKLHPNEQVERATREILRWAPRAEIYSSGSAEEMTANCDVLVTQYSSVAFVGLALGKEVHSYFDVAELARLLPEQNGSAAANIARVCRQVVADDEAAPVAQAGTPRLDRARSAHELLWADPADNPLHKGAA